MSDKKRRSKLAKAIKADKRFSDEYRQYRERQRLFTLTPIAHGVRMAVQEMNNAS